jgi:hypothetical protein
VTEVDWPMGTDRDRSNRPLVFSPKGFLVAIFRNDAAGMAARADLEADGFASEDLRLYSSKEMLDDHERYLGKRSMARRLVGALTEDQSDIELYFAYAHEGRSALWIHVPEKSEAFRAMRYVTSHQLLHFRYLGHDSDEVVPAL